MKAWRDAIGVLELHPHLHVSGYDSLTVQPAEGKSTPEFVAALEQLGFEIHRSETRISADLWFGNYAVKLGASAAIEPPAPEVVEALPEAAEVPAEVEA